MVEKITMNVNDTLELDYLVEKVDDSVIDVTPQPSDASFSLDYLKKQFGVFDPSDTGTYQLNINGQTIEVEVTDIPNSGVAQYTFDDADTDSGTALDVWNNNDATINGATTGGSGANKTYSTNEAYDFNASNGDNVQTPIADTFSTFSFATWVNFDSGSASNQHVVSTRGSPAGAALRQRNGSHQFFIYDSGNSTFVDLSGSNITANSWYHVVGVVDSTEIRLYVDGSPSASSTYNTYENGNDVVIGADPRGQSYVDGLIDDPRIYDIALSGTEVSDLYNTGSING